VKLGLGNLGEKFKGLKEDIFLESSMVIFEFRTQFCSSKLPCILACLLLLHYRKALNF
jgi:hypothetical protein